MTGAKGKIGAITDSNTMTCFMLSPRGRNACLNTAVVSIATMKLCSRKSGPQVHDLQRMKRLGRSLSNRPPVACLFQWQRGEMTLNAFSDADWAANKQSRRSVNGGMIYQRLDRAAKRSRHKRGGIRAAIDCMGAQRFAIDLGGITCGSRKKIRNNGSKCCMAGGREIESD